MEIKKIFKHGLVALASFTLLGILWMPLQNKYTSLFRSVTARFFVSPSSQLGFRFEQVYNNPKHNFSIFFYNKKEMETAQRKSVPTKIKQGLTSFDTWHLSYLPLIFLLSLIIATPVSAKRKWRAVGFGCLLLIAFTTLKIYISLFFYLNALHMSPWNYSPAAVLLINRLFMIFVVNLGVNATLPVLIWIAVTFRKEDFYLSHINANNLNMTSLSQLKT